ncbi:hypothetical protein EJD97_017678 [Solanum chilense]|uniref:RING-type E3 ubiquitin transferase n=1 Tax=Solanum chilense TaxID=4083 RepID=A0A6N2B2K0_SOLCI|nr:hypothetical protein EJD97_017678 [Solanum chilense]
MTSPSHRSRIFYTRPEFHLIGMVPNILEIYHSSNENLIVVLGNGTNIYYVSIVPRNPFSFWIPQGFLTNTMIPNFSLSLPRILWNYTPRLAEVNHALDRMTLPLRLTNFPMDDYSDGQSIGIVDCHHTFHSDCISQWLMQKNSCPLCKRIALAV